MGDDADAQAKADLADIPKIPYSRGLRLSWREIMRIAMAASVLVLLLVMQQPCATAVSKFVTGFDLGSDAAPAAGSNLVRLKSGLTDEEMKREIEKARGVTSPAPAPAP